MPLNKLGIKDFRPDKIVKKLSQLAKFCKRFHSPLSIKYYLSFFNYFWLRRAEKYRHDEIFSLGLLSSSPSDKNTNKYISQKKFNKTLWTLNGMSKWYVTSLNKGIFYNFCERLNLPIPKLYAIIFRDFLSVSYITDSPLLDKDNLVQFITNELPNEFVVKPILGQGGESVNFYTKADNGIIDGLANVTSAHEIYESIINNKKYDSFIVQEKLKNQPCFLKISPSQNLHTIRIITLVNSSKQFKILNGHLNIASGPKITSQQGDLKINISLDDGTLEYGILFDLKKGGFKKVTEHPETDLKFNEFKLPFWDEVIAISKKAALNFLPMRTLGWDFALTEKGPILLETNTSYYPPNYFSQMDEFKKILLTP